VLQRSLLSLIQHAEKRHDGGVGIWEVESRSNRLPKVAGRSGFPPDGGSAADLNSWSGRLNATSNTVQSAATEPWVFAKRG
jgi:hypothetical protein